MSLPVSTTQPAELFVTARAGHVRAATVLLDGIMTRRTTFHLDEYRLGWQLSLVVP